MKRMISLLLALALLFTLLPLAGLTVRADAPETLTVGNTRADIVYLLWWMQNCPEPTVTEHPFEDLSESAEYYKAALWAYETGLTYGVDDTHFAPNKVISRGEVIYFLWTACGKPAATAELLLYSDVYSSDWYYSAVLWAQDKDWIDLGNDYMFEFRPLKTVGKMTATRSADGVSFALQSNPDAENTCGMSDDNLLWFFDEETGTLTLTGYGEMLNFGGEHDCPWEALRQKIKALDLPDGLTSIGWEAFRNCNGLTDVSLPDSVESIGNLAFYNCASLYDVRFSRQLVYIGLSAFAGCDELTELVFPQRLETIDDGAFASCLNLENVVFPASLKEIRTAAFYQCDKLTSVKIPAGVKKIGLRALGYTGSDYNTKVEGFTIYGEKGSAAETYAQENGFRFIPFDDQPEPPVQSAFVDVKPSDWFFTAVHWATTQNPPITNGVDATHFEPYNTCSRAEFVQFLYNAWGKPAVGDAQNPFEDVAEDAWYYKAVLWAYMQGVTSGIDATHFAPNKKCTRAEVVQFLSNSSGGDLPEEQENPFVDVSADDWYYNAVRWAARWHITSGVDETHFAPGKTCTRAEVVQFLYQLDQMSESMK